MNKVGLILISSVITAMVVSGFRDSEISITNYGNKKICTENTEGGNEVIIGSQVWMNKNLDVGKFRNGDPIPEAKTNEEWVKAGETKQPAWCYYGNNPENGKKYGKLYNWYAVNDPRGLAPAGWHVPSDEEWTKLIDFLGGSFISVTAMRSQNGWAENGNGSNSSGFSGLPGGCRADFAVFEQIGESAYWWSATESNTYYAWMRGLVIDNRDVYRNESIKGEGLSVRCLRD